MGGIPPFQRDTGRPGRTGHQSVSGIAVLYMALSSWAPGGRRLLLETIATSLAQFAAVTCHPERNASE